MTEQQLQEARKLIDFLRANKGWFAGGPMTEPWESRAVAKLAEFLNEEPMIKLGDRVSDRENDTGIVAKIDDQGVWVDGGYGRLWGPYQPSDLTVEEATDDQA